RNNRCRPSPTPPRQTTDRRRGRECRTQVLLHRDVVSLFECGRAFSLFVVADSIHASSARLVSLFALPPSIFLSLRGGTCHRRPDCSAYTQLRNARVNDRLLPPALRRLLSRPCH